MKDAIIVDLDGTLCNSEHRVHFMKRKPKDWDGFYAGIPDDEIVPPVQAVIYMARAAGYEIIYITGRPGTYRDVTEKWLHANDVHSHLFMRAADDRRADDIVKAEIYRYSVEPHYRVAFALEDRSRVVEMWRSIGVACFQVAPGDF